MSEVDNEGKYSAQGLREQADGSPSAQGREDTAWWGPRVLRDPHSRRNPSCQLIHLFFSALFWKSKIIRWLL